MLASRVPQCNTIKGKTLGAAALLDRIDLLRDDPQIIQTTISSMFDAPDYHRLLSSFQGGTTQPPPKRAIKFVNALHKARVPWSNRLVCPAELIQCTRPGARIRRWVPRNQE